MGRSTPFSVALCLSLMLPLSAGAAVVSITDVDVKPGDVTYSKDGVKDVVTIKKTKVTNGSSTLGPNDELKFNVMLKDFKLTVSDSGTTGPESVHITLFGSAIKHYSYSLMFTGDTPADAAVPNPVTGTVNSIFSLGGEEKNFPQEFVKKEFFFTDLHLTIKNLSSLNMTITDVTLGLDADTIAASVPLPFGGVLMASALGALGLLRGRRRRQAQTPAGWNAAVSI